MYYNMSHVNRNCKANKVGVLKCLNAIGNVL